MKSHVDPPTIVHNAVLRHRGSSYLLIVACDPPFLNAIACTSYAMTNTGNM
jgi:molybdopterin-guanine dinucleotide biosynthesis protein A